MDEKLIKIDEILRKDIKKKEKLYGIFDGALIEGLWLNLDHWKLDFLPLYRGDHERIAEAIPYVIELDKKKDELACNTLFESIGKNSTLFISNSLKLDIFTEKMQFFYHIKTSSGESALRRFYDPRIFADFIKGMNSENRVRFFKDTSAFYSETDQGKKLVSYKKKSNQLVTESYSLIDDSDDKKTKVNDEKVNT